MKILVTGGAGFIGSAVIRLAVSQGYQVVNVDCLTYASNPENLAPILPDKNYTFEQVDIRDRGAIDGVLAEHAPDSVIHLAAESHVDKSIDGPEDFISTNIDGTFHLLQAARAYYGILRGKDQKTFRFIHVSTDEVYGDLSEEEPAFTEARPYAPSSPYSASKAASDHLARAWHKTYGLPVIVTNCSNNYGPYQFPEKLIPVVILRCLENKPVPVYGQGTNIRDWLYVEDHADALLTVLTKGQAGETYNIGGNNERRNIDLVHIICDVMDELRPGHDGARYSDLITFVTDRPGHDRRYAVNAGKIKADLGWEPRVKFDEGFRETVKWYLENEDWWRPLLARKETQSRQGLRS